MTSKLTSSLVARARSLPGVEGRVPMLQRSPVKELVAIFEKKDTNHTLSKGSKQTNARKWIKKKSGLYGWAKVKSWR